MFIVAMLMGDATYGEFLRQGDLSYHLSEIMVQPCIFQLAGKNSRWQ